MLKFKSLCLVSILFFAVEIILGRLAVSDLQEKTISMRYFDFVFTSPSALADSTSRAVIHAHNKSRRRLDRSGRTLLHHQPER